MPLLLFLSGLVRAADRDADGVDDLLDVCALVPDPGQADTDGDGTGDACDVCVGPSDGRRLFRAAGAEIVDVYTNPVGQSLEVADVDADGDSDALVVTASTVDDGLFLARNDGSSFDPAAYPYRTGLEAVKAVDLDADGRLDVAVAHADLDDRILLVDGAGGARVLARQRGVLQLEFVDVDLDGDLDLVTRAGQPAGPLSWFENLGGAFGPRTEITSISAAPVRVGDLDLDGDPDLVATDRGDALWFPNDGAGFGPGRPIGPASATALADLDGDGDLDLATSTYGVGVGWRANDGGGTFGAERPLDQPLTFGVVDAQDVDGDGDADLVLGEYRRVLWLENLADGVFATTAQALETQDFDEPHHARSVDVDADGTLDLVVGWEGSARWYRGDPCATLDTDADGWSDARELLATGTDPSLADTDGDGLADPDELAAGTDALRADTDGDGAPDGAEVCPLDATNDPDADGTCQEVDNCPSLANASQADADADGAGDACDPCFGTGADGDGDGFCDDRDTCVLVADPAQADLDGDGTGNLCDVCPGPGDGLELFAPGQGLHPRSVSIAASDLDLDGDPDLLGTVDGDAVAFENLGGGQVGAPVILAPDAEWPFGADLDGDGLEDVVAVGRAGVVWARNLGGMAFGAPTALPQAGAGVVVALDWDGDGDLDLARPSGDSVVWAPNDGLGGFAAWWMLASASDPVHLEVADLDGDGRDDLVAAGSGVTPLRWFRNRGGVAAARPVEPQTLPTRGLDAGDLDGDGDVDLVSEIDEEGAVWYENNGAGWFLPRALVHPTDLRAGGWNDSGHAFLADLDRDGDGDLVTGLGHLRGVGWVENLGEGRFDVLRELGTTESYAGATAVDLDVDGWPDVVTADARLGTTWYRSADCGRRDTDGDGVVDADELLVLGTAVLRPDTDGDGLVDGDEVLAGADPFVRDSDGDGALDGPDICPTDPLDDLDADGVCGSEDVCPTVPDPAQRDRDADGRGDACDACVGEGTEDPDGDGLCSSIDVCDVLPGRSFADADHDGTGDACDVCPTADSTGLEWFGEDARELVPCLGNEFCTTSPVRAWTVDIDADGDLDPVWLNVDAYFAVDEEGWLGWIENRRDDSFGVLADGIASVVDLRGVAWADLDGDGAVDVVTAERGTSSVTVHLNDGAGVFAPAATLSSTIPGPSGVAA